MKWLVLVHVLGATIWVGGHLILSLGFLPHALRTKDINIITNFEKNYERIGIPALLIQIITGFWMASLYIPFNQWWSLASPHHHYLWIKIGLLLGTLVLAVHARLMIIPRLTIEQLPSLAFHIVLATVLAVSFVIAGLSFRFIFF
ncbi:MAG: CopD family protein [Cyclobacteriaceae bacterium]|nr:CopD family protein [Cyclobacteriaceae bacterium]